MRLAAQIHLAQAQMDRQRATPGWQHCLVRCRAVEVSGNVEEAVEICAVLTSAWGWCEFGASVADLGEYLLLCFGRPSLQ